MPADFAAAQERIAARRAQRAASARAHPEPRPSRAVSLPFPFGRLTSAGLSAWAAVKGREGTRPEFRVGQVDAELLDEELLQLLKAQVGDGLRYFGSHITDTYSPEILLALRAVLFKLSVWSNNASYGAHLQGLRYTDARSAALHRPPPTQWQKAAYGLLTVGGRYAWRKWEDHLLAATEDPARPADPNLAALARLTDALSTAHDAAALASFLVFLVNGRYRTLTDRLLRLRLAPAAHSTSREVSFEYLNRQLVWHAFTEFLLFLLPLVGISRWRRLLSRSLRRLRIAALTLTGRSASAADDPEPHTTGELAFLPERTCAVCYAAANPTDAALLPSTDTGVLGSAATDITNPYAARPCGCLYCFACIAQRLAAEEGEGWLCLRCGVVATTCAPWDGDMIEPARAKARAKAVGFAQDTHNTAIHDHTDIHDDTPGVADVRVHPDTTADDETPLHTTAPLHLDASLALTERDAWARSEDGNDNDHDEENEDFKQDSEDKEDSEDAYADSDGDAQSEEYDEDEELEGEELEGDFEGV